MESWFELGSFAVDELILLVRSWSVRRVKYLYTSINDLLAAELYKFDSK